MIVKILKIKGGITMRIFGPSERYALKELAFMNMMDGGMTGRYVTGRELIAILSRADEYLAEQRAKNAKVNIRPVDTPGEPGMQDAEAKESKEDKEQEEPMDEVEDDSSPTTSEF